MCVIIVDAGFADSYITTHDSVDAVITASGLSNPSANESTPATFDYTVNGETVSITVWLITSDSDGWHKYSGTYTVPEDQYYHGILMGIFAYKSGWYVKSNKETGDGYGGIIIKTEDEDVGAIIEVKYAKAEKGGGKPNEVMYKKCEEAIRQIDEKHYTDALIDDGCQTI